MWLGGAKNEYQKDVCLEEIGSHAQNMTTILDSIVHIIVGGGEYDHSMSTSIFTSITYYKTINLASLTISL